MFHLAGNMLYHPFPLTKMINLLHTLFILQTYSSKQH